MPLKINRLKFETSLEKKLKEINRIRNNIVHKGMTEEEINFLLDHTFSKIKESYFQLLVQLINKQIFSVVTQNKLGIKSIRFCTKIITTKNEYEDYYNNNSENYCSFFFSHFEIQFSILITLFILII